MYDGCAECCLGGGNIGLCDVCRLFPSPRGRVRKESSARGEKKQPKKIKRGEGKKKKNQPEKEYIYLYIYIYNPLPKGGGAPAPAAEQQEGPSAPKRRDAAPLDPHGDTAGRQPAAITVRVQYGYGTTTPPRGLLHGGEIGCSTEELETESFGDGGELKTGKTEESPG